MHISSLVVIHIFCPIFIGLFVFLLSHKISIYSGYSTYQIHNLQIVSWCVACLFLLLMTTFEGKDLNFDETHSVFIVFFFMEHGVEYSIKLLIVLFNSSIFLLVFNLVLLSTTEKQLLKIPTIIIICL